MKNTYFSSLITIVVFCLFALSTAKAQIELKIDPYVILANRIQISAEYLANTNMGLELIIGHRHSRSFSRASSCSDLMQKGSSLRMIAKLYLNPKKTSDRWHLGLYIGSENIALHCEQGNSREEGVYSKGNSGLSFGYKWHLEPGFLFEFTSGLGYAFGDDTSFFSELDAFLRISVGYRF